MDARVIRGRTFLVPARNPAERTERTDPPQRDETFSGAVVRAADWSRLQLAGGAISNCILDRVAAPNTAISSFRVTGSLLVGVDLSAARWEDVKLDRCSFEDCKLLGANLTRVTAKDVIFERCVLDYAVLDSVRSSGNVAFIGCTFREAVVQDCRLQSVILADCLLSKTEFKSCDLRGADFRGSDVQAVTGVDSLRGIVLESGQLMQLTDAVVSDFDIDVQD